MWAIFLLWWRKWAIPIVRWLNVSHFSVQMAKMSHSSSRLTEKCSGKIYTTGHGMLDLSCWRLGLWWIDSGSAALGRLSSQSRQGIIRMLLEIMSAILILPMARQDASSVFQCTFRVHSAKFRFSVALNRWTIITIALPEIARSKGAQWVL